MLHRNVRLVTIPLLEQSENPPSDEFFFKHLVHDLINDVPLDELKKIFRMRKFDPRDPEPDMSLLGIEAYRLERDLRMHLRQQQVVQFEVSIVTQD